jgi:macrodomain Ter protein organizer (MatP/YcbG family)
MARTTIDLDPAVLRRLKERSRREGKTLGQLASRLLADALHSSDKPVSSKLEWTSHPMGARIDLEDKEAVHRLLENR